MGKGRKHQRYADAPLFRCVITHTYDPEIDPRPYHYPVSGENTIITIKGPYNTTAPARAAKCRAEREQERYPRRGETVKARVQVGVVNWGDLV